MKLQSLCFVLPLAFCFLIPANLAAQSEKYALKDSANIRDKDRMRQWSYENNLSNYPAPKQSNWSVGVKGGYPWVAGDVRPNDGMGFGLNVRRSLGHAFSLRLEGTGGQAKGLDWRRHGGHENNLALNGTLNPDVNYTTIPPVGAPQYPTGFDTSFVFHNYKMNYYDVHLSALINLNNLNFYNKSAKWSIFGQIGGGVLLYHTAVDQFDENNNMMYGYGSVQQTDFSNQTKRDAINALENMLDGNYETDAEFNPNAPAFGKFNLNPSMVVGGGIAFKVSRRIDVSLEHRVTVAFDDLLDGQRWEETNTLTASADYLQYTSIGLNFRLGKGEDAQWWTNPLDEPLDRIRMLEKNSGRETKDSDNDGVVDALDQEPMSHPKAKVDTRGVALDSDEDGVPDWKDAQPFTPKGAQVDTDGLALDSDNDGVIDFYDQEMNSAPGAQVDARGVTIQAQSSGSGSTAPANLNMMLPLINFDFGSAEIKDEYYPQLYNVARIMTMDPNLKLRVIGHADNRSTDEYNFELSEKRAKNTIDFLVKNFGIDANRLVPAHRGANEPMIKALPKNRDKKFEKFHHLNRRVEFQVLEQ